MTILKKIAILCDLNNSSGLGHLSRMKNLSIELEKKGSKCYFMFCEKDKEYVTKHAKNLRIIFFPNRGKIKSIKDTLLENNFLILILDSYENNLLLEKTLVKKSLFVVSVDDHLRKHFSNIVVSNRAEHVNINKKNPYQIWLTGSKYILVTKNTKIVKKFQHKSKKLRVLLHAGGSSSYKYVKEFTTAALDAINKYNLDASILCTSKVSKNYIKIISRKYKNSSKLKIFPYIKNLSKKIKYYDIVAGPAGTTTFEAILSGVVPFSVPLKNDGRDSVKSWNSLGHLIHLTNKEKKNKAILKDMWTLILTNYKKLSYLLIKNSKQLDGQGPRRLAEKIIFYFKKGKKKLINENHENKNNLIISKKCQILDARNFLNVRNQKLVRAMSTSNRIITWPEHINWWLRNDIKKYKLIKEGYTVGYHWSKINKDNKENFVTSAWFLSKDQPEKLQLAYEILKIQSKLVKKIYKNSTWIISMKKNNKFVQRLNAKFGFYLASDRSISRILTDSSQKNANMQFMEMKV
jgi:spore coat polysaccharide biosynthesis predicted glycosyltransferase SpsG